MRRFISIGALVAALLFMAGPMAGPTAFAADVRVAVASNFSQPARDIASTFQARTGHGVLISVGSTGTLFAQIAQGAPFDVFLAADSERSQAAVERGFAVSGTRFIYAEGRLALLSMEADGATARAALETGRGRLAIANPDTAPYGRAAVETLLSLGLFDAAEPRLVRGSNIAQAYQFTVTGNAGLGFVALSQVTDRPSEAYWSVPPDLHTPIAQEAVLLTHAADPEAAKAFLEFLRGPEARAIIRRYGYGVTE